MLEALIQLDMEWAMEVTLNGKPLEAIIQWEFQDPKMEVLYHTRPYVVGVFPYIGRKDRPYIW